MKQRKNKWLAAVGAGALLLACEPVMKAQAAKAFEIGAGGALVNYTRMAVNDFTQVDGGYLFTLEDRHLFGGAGLYLAGELLPWLYWDVQGTVGTARYLTESGSARGFSWMAGPGLQVRPFVKSAWLVPYFRLGINYFQKNFDARYFGSFAEDETRQASWTLLQDAWNDRPDDTKEPQFPLSAGAGIIGWLSNRVGIGVQGDYLAATGTTGRNFAQGSLRLILRFGGADKHPVTYEKVYVDRTVEVPVEKWREKTVTVTLSDLMDNVNFEFDSAVLTEASLQTLRQVASALKEYRGRKFLVAGYTDARGSEEYNLELSRKRAKAVYDVLLDFGVPPGQLCWYGFGKRAAILPASASDSQRLGDRKVVIESVRDGEWWQYLSGEAE